MKRLLTATTALFWLSAAHASTFEEALTSAYETNPRIKAERDRLQSTDESLATATSGFRPTATASVDHGRQETSYDGADDRVGNYTNKLLRVEEPLFRGGGTFSSLNSARQKVKAGQADLSALEQQVMLDAITAYMDVVTNCTILDLAHSNENLLADQMKSTNTRFQVGEVTRTDVAQSQSRLADAHAAVVTAEGALVSSIATYERVMGYRPAGTLAVPEKLPELPLSLNEAIQRAHDANPQLLSAIHTAKSSLYDVRTTESYLLPTVSLVGSISRQDGAGAFGLDKFNQDQIGVEVHVPLYQSGSEYARVRSAKDVARQRDHQSTDTRQSVEQSVTQAWQQLQTTTAVISARAEQVKTAEMAVGGIRQENEAGVRTLLDVLDTERDLFDARTTLARAERDRIVAAYTLSFRLGQLTPAMLALNTPSYDPTKHAKEVTWQPIGF